MVYPRVSRGSIKCKFLLFIGIFVKRQYYSSEEVLSGFQPGSVVLLS
jgi:hypothetical protein